MSKGKGDRYSYANRKKDRKQKRGKKRRGRSRRQSGAFPYSMKARMHRQKVDKLQGEKKRLLTAGWTKREVERSTMVRGGMTGGKSRMKYKVAGVRKN